eukprot:TRINITY_DN39628_c1_g5_i4.p4 TRINITY_DN39628_c1_g5~~TRINITY_DN39628_c1_g5_i4.p4  ORF type:complete len:141 (-),score=36.57 TRINITY_DN39628_c1_g5_i4:1468-1890(-)
MGHDCRKSPGALAKAILALTGVIVIAGCENSSQNGGEAGSTATGSTPAEASPTDQDRPTTEQPSDDAASEATPDPEPTAEPSAETEPGAGTESDPTQPFTELGVTDVQIGDGAVADDKDKEKRGNSTNVVNQQQQKSIVL